MTKKSREEEETRKKKKNKARTWTGVTNRIKRIRTWGDIEKDDLSDGRTIGDPGSGRAEGR